MTPLPPEIMFELQQEYVLGFKEKIAEIETHFQNKNWSELIVIFHKSAGSGATYRMPEISEIATGIEYYLKKVSPPDVNLLSQAVELFKQVLSARLQGQALNLEGHETFNTLAQYRPR